MSRADHAAIHVFGERTNNHAAAQATRLRG